MAFPNYKVGELSELISAQKHKSKMKHTPKSEKEKKKLADLFSQSQSSIFNTIPSTLSSTQIPIVKVKENKKRKLSDVEPVITHTKQDGFNPPPGIVHEALQKQNKKRKKDKGDTGSEVKQKPSRASRRESEDDDEDKPKHPPRRKKPKRDQVKESRTIFVGNLSVSMDRKELKKLFRKFGKIESVRIRCAAPADPKVPKRVAAIRKEFHPERPTLAAYVCFKEEESAKNALKLNGVKVKDFHLRVDVASQDKKHDHKHSIFVGNLPFNISEEEVWNHFEVCGEVDNVRIIRDRKTGLGKGFGYVLFKSVDSVSLALKLNDSELSGREVRVIASKEHHTPDRQSTHTKTDSRKSNQKFMKPGNKRSGSRESSNKHVNKLKSKKFKPSNVQVSSFQGFKVDNCSKNKQKKKLKKSQISKSGLILKKSFSKTGNVKDGKINKSRDKKSNKNKQNVSKHKVKKVKHK